jgi:ABC-type Na+ transport system ATPase subunit NatA
VRTTFTVRRSRILVTLLEKTSGVVRVGAFDTDRQPARSAR